MSMSIYKTVLTQYNIWRERKKTAAFESSRCSSNSPLIDWQHKLDMGDEVTDSNSELIDAGLESQRTGLLTINATFIQKLKH